MGGCYRLAMAPGPASLLAGTDLLVVDGTNLLHRIGSGGPAPVAALVGRLRSVIPPAIAIEIVLDGGGHGVTGRIAERMHVRPSRRRPGDELLLELASAAGPRALAVTDDRDLRERLLQAGVRSVPTAWLVARLALPRLAAPAPGNPRPPRPTTPGDGGGEGDGDAPRWSPGRGATRKVGPARRVARHRRRPGPR